MPEYDTVPGVDAENKFPPAVRQAMAESDENAAVISTKITSETPAIVTEELASNLTVVEAAATAVDAELAGRHVMETHEVLEDDIAFSIVDEDQRRFWFESGYDARPTDYAAERIVSKIGPMISEDIIESIGIESINTEITGHIFVITDEDGYIIRDAQWGPDGRFLQEVIDSIAARIVVPAPVEPTNIIIPSAIPVVVGTTYKLFFREFIDALSLDATPLVNTVGNNLGSYWQYTPTVAGTQNLKVTVVDRVGATIKESTVAITAYAPVSGTGKRLLGIGDSISRAGGYLNAAVQTLEPDAATVGTRTYNGGALNVEGRGGWSLNTYFTNVASNTSVDSPFLFPTNVAGEKYWGNTEQWRKICYVPMAELPSAGYDFLGFQWLARGWKNDTNPWLYNSNGYPVSPAEGDVVNNPTKPAGSQFEQYIGGVWTTIATPTMEFNFSKYMARYAVAFQSGPPTHISFMLETNDFFNGLTDSAFDLWKSRLDILIASVRAWSETVPFIICLAPTGGTADKWGSTTTQKFSFDRRMREAATRILAAYQTSSAVANKVYVVTFLGSVTPTNIDDNLHPNAAGHTEMGVYLGGMLTKLVTEGT